MLEHFDLKDYVWNDTVTVQSNPDDSGPFLSEFEFDVGSEKYGTQLHFHKTYLKMNSGNKIRIGIRLLNSVTGFKLEKQKKSAIADRLRFYVLVFKNELICF
ncbi:MAG: hypothetical protein R2799_16165 [Crocinitomicaceae bacterium]